MCPGCVNGSLNGSDHRGGKQMLVTVVTLISIGNVMIHFVDFVIFDDLVNISKHLVISK